MQIYMTDELCSLLMGYYIYCDRYLINKHVYLEALTELLFDSKKMMRNDIGMVKDPTNLLNY